MFFEKFAYHNSINRDIAALYRLILKLTNLFDVVDI